MFIIVIVGLLLSWRLFVIVLHLVKKRLQLSAIPQPPMDNWFVGHSNTINKAKDNNTFLDLIVRWVEEYGEMFVFWVGRNPVIFCNEPGMLKEICTDLKGFKKLSKLPIRYFYDQKIIGTESILSGNGILWALKRKAMTNFFAKTNMEELFDVCKPHIEAYQRDRMRGIVGQGTILDLHEQVECMILSYLQVLGLNKFTSPEYNAAENFKILEAMGQVRDHLFFKKMSKDKQDIADMIQNRRERLTEVIMDKITDMGLHNDDLSPTDLVGHLIKANYRTSGSNRRNKMDRVRQLSVDDLMTVLLVMDNIVKELTSMFMFLNDVPEVQKKMFEELREKPVTDYASLDDLKYTERCLLETLRMGPALFKGSRTYKTGKTQRFGPYKVHSPKVRILYSEWAMHYNEKYWPNPKKFDPERWADGFTPAPFTYFPFFMGPRGCLGKHMAMMMMKLTLSVLVQNFDITQKFDEKKPPIINQANAIMSIFNRVDCYLEPAKT